jgi:hypothetical protein
MPPREATNARGDSAAAQYAARVSQALLDHMNPRYPPAFEESGLGFLRGFQIIQVSVYLVIETGDVNSVVYRAIIFDAHEPLREQVDRPLGRAAIKAEVQAGREADEAFVKMFVGCGCLTPDFFQDLVTGEVVAPVEERNGFVELVVHR